MAQSFFPIDPVDVSPPILSEEQTSQDSFWMLLSGVVTIRAGQKLTISNRSVLTLSLLLKKQGSPTGDVTFTIRKVSDDSVILSKVWGDASGLQGSATWEKVTFDAAAAINEEVRMLAEYSNGDFLNHVRIYYDSSDVKGGEGFTKYANGAYTDESYDGAYKYEYISTDWQDVDVSAHIPAGSTGALLHCVNTGTVYSYYLGLRKNGSTDDRNEAIYQDTHSWAAIGVDASRIFEARIYGPAGSNPTDVILYLVGYTKAGVTFFTNAYDKSLGVTGSWQGIDCSTEAPNAIGLIFEVRTTDVGAVWPNFGLRKNGSTDNRTNGTWQHNTFGVIVGCDNSQIVGGYISNTIVDFFLVGYITDGATFNTNATDVSLSSTGSWIDLSALPTNSGVALIEVVGNVKFGLRKNGSAEDIYHWSVYHPWAFVECDSTCLIEGKISTTAGDFFLVGYTEGTCALPVAVGRLVYGGLVNSGLVGGRLTG